MAAVGDRKSKSELRKAIDEIVAGLEGYEQ